MSEYSKFRNQDSFQCNVCHHFDRFNCACSEEPYCVMEVERAYQQGIADAESEWNKDHQLIKAYNDGVENGRADEKENLALEYAKLAQYRNQIRADAIDEIIKFAHEDATSGNMIVNLNDIIQLKEQK